MPSCEIQEYLSTSGHSGLWGYRNPTLNTQLDKQARTDGKEQGSGRGKEQWARSDLPNKPSTRLNRIEVFNMQFARPYRARSSHFMFSHQVPILAHPDVHPSAVATDSSSSLRVNTHELRALFFCSVHGIPEIALFYLQRAPLGVAMAPLSSC